jgi:NADP-dependent 3-hydroxy acid dehydrogenase YdfG
MLALTGKNVVVIGGSRGVGRRVVEAALYNGARVLAVARQEIALWQLAKEASGAEILSLDATDDDAPGKVFDTLRIAFNFCKAALLRPLPAGASVVLISSGAALAGSPISGGYAGAKRTQIFIAAYSQKESDRLELGLRFTALAPRMIPETDLGRHAVAGYSRYLGMSAADFIKSMDSPPTASDVAAAVIQVATNPDHSKGKTFVVSAKGLQAAA